MTEKWQKQLSCLVPECFDVGRCKAGCEHMQCCHSCVLQESHNRAARQRIPHRVYTDGEGQEHVQVLFFLLLICFFATSGSRDACMHCMLCCWGCKPCRCSVWKASLHTLSQQVQFIARGPSGKARVSADMYQDAGKKWQYYYLIVDVDGGRGRISIVDPRH
jgi:hypothetical protein